MPRIRPTGDPHANARLVGVDTGVELSVTDLGDGLPVVMVHGVCMSSAYFHPTVPAVVEAGMRAIAVDLRGHGRSPAVDGGHTVAGYARDLDALLRALRIERCALVGWSMGSLVIWEHLRQFGAARVAGHVNVSQGPTDCAGPDFPDAPLTLAAIAEFANALQGDPRAAWEHFAPVMFRDELDPDDLAWCVDEILPIGANAGTCILLDQTAYDAREAIAASGPVPTLNVWGSDEKLIPRSMGAWCRDRIAGSTYVELEASGHCPQLEEPERFNRLLVDWIRPLA